MFNIDLVRCNRCGMVRERFILACTKCSGLDSQPVDTNNDNEVSKIMREDLIKEGAELFKKELDDNQKKYFREAIPSNEPWEFYAGILQANRLALIWLKHALPFNVYSQPISVVNARVMYIMSYKSKTERQQFCKYLNELNGVKDDISTKDEGSNDNEIGDSFDVS